MDKDFGQCYLTLFQELFEGRKDCYGVRLSSGQEWAEKKALTADVLRGHLKGKKRIGVYPLVEDKCKFAVVDFDRDNFQDASAIVKRLSSYRLPAYVERSKSKGFHIWLFFSNWTKARKVRTILKATLEELALEAEIFPKQDSTKNGGLGNYIYLPFFNLDNNGGRTVFLDEEGNPYPEQIKILQQIQHVNPASLDEILQAEMETKSNSSPAPLPSTHVPYINDTFSAILSNCEYLEGLRWKIKETGDLEHIERIYFANVFLPLPGGREWIIDMFSCLSDFNTKVTETQLNSLKGGPTLCSSMCTELCEAIQKRNAKSPIAFALDGQIAKDFVGNTFEGRHEILDNNSSENGYRSQNEQECQGRHPSIEKLFCSTSHLPNFENLRIMTDLLGEAYVPILKAIYYLIASTKISKKIIRLGRIKTDTRISVLVPLISGGGKLKIKSAIKDSLKNKNIGEPSSLHSEQLVGKVVERKKNNTYLYEKIDGYFSVDLLVLDEAYTLWTSNDLVYTESRKYLRDALDPYGDNLITKKPVDVPFSDKLAYYPHFACIVFIQPLPLLPSRVYDGDTRRYLIPFVNLLKIDRRQALRERASQGNSSSESAKKEFANFYENLSNDFEFEFDQDVAKEFTCLSELLVDYGFQYSEKISFHTNYKQFTIQEYFLKMAAIIAFIQRRRQITIEDIKITIEDIKLAFCDLFEFLTLEFDFIERHVLGTLDYGAGFKGAVDKDQQCLRWLYNKGATSKESSNVTIADYLKEICNIFNLDARQTHRNYEEHKKKGWVKGEQEGQHSSKVWLAFSPEFLTPKAYHSFEEIYSTYKKNLSGTCQP